ncbi:MAG: TetR/AcrR family transcriptional regulator [Actinobacteria bacterium]|nr:MAG: TetR/AcrR family transcriptional regulator [Actinomycetota bacterium]
MSPRSADPALRTALVESAARLIAEEGAAGLTLRRLAREVGTSTMVVYTHFGGMEELRQEVRREGFGRLAEHLNGVVPSRDPVFDLGLLGWAYCRNALTNPNLYRVMFMEVTAPGGPVIGYDTFETLVKAVDRAAQAGRFTPGNEVERARQVWALSHGTLALHLANLLTVDEVLETLWQGAVHLFIGFGDEPRTTRRSMERMRRSLTPRKG